MLAQELKEIWKNSSQAEKIKFETSRLLIDLNAKMNRMEKVIKRRDVREIAASVFGILLFGYFTYEIPFPMTKIACVLSMVWFGYLIYKLKKNKNQKHSNDLAIPLNEQLVNQKENLQKEANLLNTVLYWYVLPPLFANLLFILGFGDPAAYDWHPFIIEKLLEGNMLYILPISIKMKMVYITGSLLFNVFVIWINKRAVRKGINPIIKDIERMQAQLESDNQVAV